MSLQPFEVEYDVILSDDGSVCAVEAEYWHGGHHYTVHAPDMAQLQEVVFDFCSEQEIECDGVLFYRMEELMQCQKQQ